MAHRIHPGDTRSDWRGRAVFQQLDLIWNFIFSEAFFVGVRGFERDVKSCLKTPPSCSGNRIRFTEQEGGALPDTDASLRLKTLTSHRVAVGPPSPAARERDSGLLSKG